MRILSLREKACLVEAAFGKTEKETASCLGISEHTVHAYLRGAIRKLGSRNKVHAVVRALVMRQISIEEFAGQN